jgi:tetratricopeptide (TPR) repeat protein
MELAMLAQAQQRRGEAVRQYKLVLGEDPNSHIALNNLAWILSTDNDARFRDAKQAISLAAKADELTNHSEPRILLTLSAAFAEAGEYDKAVSKAECALKLAQDRDNLEFVRLSQTLLERFRARQSFHQFCDRNVALLRQDPAAGS